MSLNKWQNKINLPKIGTCWDPYQKYLVGTLAERPARAGGGIKPLPKPAWPTKSAEEWDHYPK